MLHNGNMLRRESSRSKRNNEIDKLGRLVIMVLWMLSITCRVLNSSGIRTKPKSTYESMASPLKKRLSMPLDTLVALEKVAAVRDMLVEALIKFYVGQGLRQDLA